MVLRVIIIHWAEQYVCPSVTSKWAYNAECKYQQNKRLSVALVNNVTFLSFSKPMFTYPLYER